MKQISNRAGQLHSVVLDNCHYSEYLTSEFCDWQIGIKYSREPCNNCVTLLTKQKWTEMNCWLSGGYTVRTQRDQMTGFLQMRKWMVQLSEQGCACSQRTKVEEPEIIFNRNRVVHAFHLLRFLSLPHSCWRDCRPLPVLFPSDWAGGIWHSGWFCVWTAWLKIAQA